MRQNGRVVLCPSKALTRLVTAASLGDAPFFYAMGKFVRGLLANASAYATAKTTHISGFAVITLAQVENHR